MRMKNMPADDVTNINKSHTVTKNCFQGFKRAKCQNKKI